MNYGVINFLDLIIRDIGSNWVYLECNKGKADITCKTEDTTQPENFTIPANISLGAGKIYTCNITEGSGDSGITFELGINYNNYYYVHYRIDFDYPV